MFQGVTRLFRIETGERRYWATWLLRDFLPEYTGDGMIPCIIIPANRSSVFRQAKENTARSGLTAMALARQAALLLLTVHGYEIPAYAVENDFYRQALELDLRDKREYTDAVLSAMGGIKNPSSAPSRRCYVCPTRRWNSPTAMGLKSKAASRRGCSSGISRRNRSPNYRLQSDRANRSKNCVKAMTFRTPMRDPSRSFHQPHSKWQRWHRRLVRPHHRNWRVRSCSKKAMNDRPRKTTSDAKADQ